MEGKCVLVKNQCKFIQYSRSKVPIKTLEIFLCPLATCFETSKGILVTTGDRTHTVKEGEFIVISKDEIEFMTPLQFGRKYICLR